MKDFKSLAVLECDFIQVGKTPLMLHCLGLTTLIGVGEDFGGPFDSWRRKFGGN